MYIYISICTYMEYGIYHIYISPCVWGAGAGPPKYNNVCNIIEVKLKAINLELHCSHNFINISHLSEFKIFIPS